MLWPFTMQVCSIKKVLLDMSFMSLIHKIYELEWSVIDWQGVTLPSPQCMLGMALLQNSIPNYYGYVSLGTYRTQIAYIYEYSVFFFCFSTSLFLPIEKQ